MAKAIALLSGGLDSTLAVLVLLQQGIEVTALTFLTHFGCDITDSSSCSKDPFPAAQKFGFDVKMCHLGDSFFDIVKNPKFGHGKNMNPCIDCRILMLREAAVLMKITGADFLATGEVVGQRPMSQRRNTLALIDRQAGVEGLVVRPLSANILPPTIAHTRGLIDPDGLHGFNGRTRKPQMALAAQLGLTDYPNPAGGCLLTDPIYSYRLSELLALDPDADMADIDLLRTGRHFRLSPSCKAVIGRNERENNTIEGLVREGDVTLRVLDVGSPICLVIDKEARKRGSLPLPEHLALVASITARYSDARRNPLVEVSLFRGLSSALASMQVRPAEDETLDAYRIEAQRGSQWTHRYSVS